MIKHEPVWARVDRALVSGGVHGGVLRRTVRANRRMAEMVALDKIASVLWRPGDAHALVHSGHVVGRVSMTVAGSYLATDHSRDRRRAM